jgi:Protein of unknown function (DUF1003)
MNGRHAIELASILSSSLGCFCGRLDERRDGVGARDHRDMRGLHLLDHERSNDGAVGSAENVSHLSFEPNPVLVEQRAESIQNRIADQITAFAGSMWFVYIQIIWFASWIGFGVEYPYGLLTMIVSLEAIFLSTFVMISRNRADAKRQVIADQQWQTVKEEDKQNEQLLERSRLLEPTATGERLDELSP